MGRSKMSGPSRDRMDVMGGWIVVASTLHTGGINYSARVATCPIVRAVPTSRAAATEHFGGLNEMNNDHAELTTSDGWQI